MSCLQARERQTPAAQQPNGLTTEPERATDPTMAGTGGAADLADLTSPGAVAVTPAPQPLETSHDVFTGPSAGQTLSSEHTALIAHVTVPWIA